MYGNFIEAQSHLYTVSEYQLTGAHQNLNLFSYENVHMLWVYVEAASPHNQYLALFKLVNVTFLPNDRWWYPDILIYIECRQITQKDIDRDTTPS